MLSILNPDPVTLEARLTESPAIPKVPKTERAVAEAAKQEAPPVQFEIVLERRQIASLLFVATVVAVIVSAVSYLAGKSLSANQEQLPPLVIAPAALVPKPPPISGISADPILSAAATTIPTALGKTGPTILTRESGLPLFQDPVAGAVYIQMAAVEQGIATVFAEGLRKEGFEAFVAPGPNEKIFRVLIGPLPDPGSFQRAKDAVDKLGLSTFARKYEK